MKNKSELLRRTALAILLSGVITMGHTHPADPTQFLQPPTYQVIAPYTHLVVIKEAVAASLVYDNQCQEEFDIYLDEMDHTHVAAYASGTITFSNGQYNEVFVESDGPVIAFYLSSSQYEETINGVSATFGDLIHATDVRLQMSY